MPNQISKDKLKAGILIRKDIWAAAKDAAKHNGMSLNSYVAYTISRELRSEGGYQMEAVDAAADPQTWIAYAGK